MTLFARVVFIVLVGATFAAFFAAQRLKGAPPVVRVTKMTKFFSPNGDGVRDRNDIHVSVKQRDDVTVSVVDRDGGEVRRLVSNVPAQPFRPLDVELGRAHRRRRRRTGRAATACASRCAARGARSRCSAR